MKQILRWILVLPASVLAAFLVSSCSNEKIYYLDSSRTVHVDRKCSRIEGGVYLFSEENMSNSGNILLACCGHCMNADEMKTLKIVLELRSTKKKKSKIVDELYNFLKRNHYDSIDDIPKPEFIKRYFIENKNKESNDIYYYIHNKTSNIQQRHLEKDLHELWELDESRFVVRLKRWSMRPSGLSEELENELDLDDIRRDSLIEKSKALINNEIR